MYPDEKAASATDFLVPVTSFFAALGITVRSVMCYGPCYYSKRFRDSSKALDMTHIRTRPYSRD
jgi:hypothetical protein